MRVSSFQPFQIFQNSKKSMACIWLNGESTAVGKRGELIWNFAKFRVAADGALGIIEKRKDRVKWPDAVCGDFDSLDPKIDVGNAIKVALPDQDYTDLTKSIKWCLERKSSNLWDFERIIVLGGLNGRFDHTMATLSTLASFVENESVQIVVLDSTNLVFAIPEGESKIELSLKMITGKCGIIPLAQRETRVTSEGLKYEMADLPLEFGKIISTSNEAAQNQVSLKSTAPLLFTVELISDE